MPFGNCPEQERAPDRACTGEFGRVNGTGKGSAFPELKDTGSPDGTWSYS
ncbi:MAG: hypothetical protein Q7U51_14245 [Methanoregula sp.]|nr:hypothetical protein [Methanoregula sp.]